MEISKTVRRRLLQRIIRRKRAYIRATGQIGKSSLNVADLIAFFGSK